MPTKKKPRPSFNVPTEIGSGRDSGWVYRSSAVEEEDEPDYGARDASSLSMALSAMVQVMTLSITIATIPLTIGMRVLGAFASSGKQRSRR